VTTRVAVIGNSHIACLKTGWETLAPTYGTVALTFFGGRGRTVRDVALKGRLLVPQSDVLAQSFRFTSGGQESIALDDFDVILLFGLYANAYIADEEMFYSQQAIARTLRDLTEGAIYFRVASAIKEVVRDTVHIGHSPLLAAAKEKRSRSLEGYRRGIALMNETIFHPAGMAMVAQPDATIVNGRNTAPRYTKGARRLAVGADKGDTIQPAGNTNHMNGAFGALWLRHFFGELGIAPRRSGGIVMAALRRLVPSVNA